MSTYRYIARLGRMWRILITEDGNHWRAQLVERANGDRTTIGDYESISDAQVQSVVGARTLIQGRTGTDPGPASEWQMVRRNTSEQEFERYIEYSKIASKMGAKSAISLASMLIGTAALGVVVSLIVPAVPTHKLNSTDAELADLKNRIASIQEKVDAAAAQKALSNTSVQSLQSDVTALKQELAGFEIALGDDPAKKLAVPMLRKDLDSLREQQRADAAALHDEMARTFGLMEWLLGLLGLGSLATGITGWFTRTGASKG